VKLQVRHSAVVELNVRRGGGTAILVQLIGGSQVELSMMKLDRLAGDVHLAIGSGGEGTHRSRLLLKLMIRRWGIPRTRNREAVRLNCPPARQDVPAGQGGRQGGQHQQADDSQEPHPMSHGG
jgi:hypothetical protein